MSPLLILPTPRVDSDTRRFTTYAESATPLQPQVTHRRHRSRPTTIRGASGVMMESYSKKLATLRRNSRACETVAALQRAAFPGVRLCRAVSGRRIAEGSRHGGPLKINVAIGRI